MPCGTATIIETGWRISAANLEQLEGFIGWALLRASANPAAPALLDHLVGASEHVWRHFEAKRLGGFQVDYQLVFCRCLHR